MPAHAPTHQPRSPVGPLSAFGLSSPHQIPLLLPRRWEDLRDVRERFAFSPGDAGRFVVVTGRLAKRPERQSGPPRLSVVIKDADGRPLRFQLYGEPPALETFEETLRVRSENLAVSGELRLFGHVAQLRRASLVESEWIGRVRPVYPGSKRCPPELTRQWVTLRLDETIPIAGRWLTDKLLPLVGDMDLLRRLCEIPSGVCLERVLERAHRPLAPRQGDRAHAILERLSALGQILEAGATHDLNRAAPDWYTPGDWRLRAIALPFDPTDEQCAAVEECVSDLGGPLAMRRMLIGDVGTGKTAVYALVAAACVDGGARVAVMLPNERLAHQVHANMRSWWPDIRGLLLTGSTNGEVDVERDRLVIGTTAVLHRETGPFDLIIVDEQHKFSREQRERLLQPRTHQLEVTATCIPRSQALMKLGMIGISRLRKAHVDKRIHTRIWDSAQQVELFQALRQTCAQGHQIIVIYPRKSLNDDGKAKAAAEEAFANWDNLFPGRVALAHGGRNSEENEAAMKRMAEGDADVLIATTVVEVGIDLPRVRRVMVVQPDRLGVIQLHQLRGRAARKGGDGWFDLYLQQSVSDKTRKRLELMPRTTDGFELAELDMRLRGFGDIKAAAHKQSGADNTFLFSKNISIEAAEHVARLLETVSTRTESDTRRT